MPLTVTHIAPVAFPNDTPGQTVTRTVELGGATQPAPESVAGDITISFNGDQAVAPITSTVNAPAVSPTAAVNLNTSGVVDVQVQNIRPREGYTDRWFIDVVFTTV